MNPSAPPSFEDSPNRRYRARSAGVDPRYWYPVCRETDLAKGPIPFTFQGESFVIFRTPSGQLGALEDRCAHRQMPLSLGTVDEHGVRCAYHGWAFGEDGRLSDIPHPLFGRSRPRCRLAHRAVQARYGLVWVFFADPAQADEVPLVRIEQLEEVNPWPSFIVDYTWRCHFSLVIDNISDYSHEFVHRDLRPFEGSELVTLESTDDSVRVVYHTRVARGLPHRLALRPAGPNGLSRAELCYQYPHQWADIDGQLREYCFVTPTGPDETRVFVIYMTRPLDVAAVPRSFMRRLMQPVWGVAGRWMMNHLLSQDGVVMEAEQRAWGQHHQHPQPELNPVVPAMQRLYIDRWRQYLASRDEAGLVSIAREEQ